MEKIKSLIEITRPINLLITFAVIIVSTIICSHHFQFNSEIILAGLSAVAVAASGNIINDYFDVEIDKINRPNRPIPAGILTKREALVYYFIFLFFSISLSSLISFHSILIIIITLVLLFLYSFSLKGIPLVGNVVVSLCTALAFIYGGVVVGNINAAIIPAIFAFLVNLIREILKDIEDLEGDRINDLNTFPTSYGLKNTKILLLTITNLLVLSTFYPFIYKLYSIEYFIVVLFFVDLPLVYFLREVFSKKLLAKLSMLSLLLKIIMLFGLLSIYVGNT